MTKARAIELWKTKVAGDFPTLTKAEDRFIKDLCDRHNLRTWVDGLCRVMNG